VSLFGIRSSVVTEMDAGCISVVTVNCSPCGNVSYESVDIFRISYITKFDHSSFFLKTLLHSLIFHSVEQKLEQILSFKVSGR